MDNEVANHKKLTINQLATMVGGRIVGSIDEDIKITGTCAVDKYIDNKVTFIRNRKYGNVLADLKNVVVLLPEDMADLCESYPQNIYIIVKDALNSMLDLQDYFYMDQSTTRLEGIASSARIDKSVRIGKHVYIGDNVDVGKNSVIGDNTKILNNSYISDHVIIGYGNYIYPDVYIDRKCQIGHTCTIRSGTRIGIDDCRFEQNIEQQSVRKMIQVGKVIIGNNVEIYANCTIARATFEDDATFIEDDVKIGSLVHIAHNVRIGKRSLIAPLSCISGSAKIGDDVWIGVGVSVANGVVVKNKAKVLLNAVVAYNVEEGEMVSGFYAMPHRRWKQVYKKLRDEI